MQRIARYCFIALVLNGLLNAQSSGAEPIIDMHLHALPANYNGPPPVFICAPYPFFPAWDPASGPAAYAAAIFRNPPCSHPLRSPTTDSELMNRSLDILRAHNITALTSGPIDLVARWKLAGGDRSMPATWFEAGAGPSVDDLRKWVKSKRVAAFAEIQQQYASVSLTDPRLEPYFALAEELDVAVGIHMGPGPPGVSYFGAPGYRMKASSLLLLEDLLVRHPKLRVWASHAGWPLGDDAIAALYAHPQLYVDIGVISYVLPKPEFYEYLQRLITAGFQDRIMFGSDQMLWPDAMLAAIETIRDAPLLTERQKRDILYNNAARFLRLKQK